MLENWVFLNNGFEYEKSATISVRDRGFLFGDGIFTTIRVDEGVCEFLSDHLERLAQHAEVLQFILPKIPIDRINELIRRNNALKGIWRLKILITVSEIDSKRTPANLLMTLHPYTPTDKKYLRLTFFPFLVESPLAKIKSLSYLNSIFIKKYALENGYDDTVLLTSKGVMLETSSSNVFWIDQGVFFYPSSSLPYLKGIFLNTLLKFIPLPIVEWELPFDQISSQACMFTCNSMAHIQGVESIGPQVFRRDVDCEDVLKKAAKKALKENAIKTS